MAQEIEEGQDGLFSLCVFDSDKYSDFEIKKVFGEFGEVVKLNRSGNLTFVRYRSHDEATNCFEAMKRSNRFKVNPARKSRSSAQNSERIRESRSENNMNRGRRTNDNDGRNEACGSGFGFRQRGDNDVSPPPKLILFRPSLPPEVDKSNLPHAKILVIANFHPSFKQCDIYDLCTKAGTNPLHVAMKKFRRHPYPDMNYASIYVREEKDRKNLIDSLNNLQINGYQLIVSSYEELVDEGRSLIL